MAKRKAPRLTWRPITDLTRPNVLRRDGGSNGRYASICAELRLGSWVVASVAKFTDQDFWASHKLPQGVRELPGQMRPDQQHTDTEAGAKELAEGIARHILAEMGLDDAVLFPDRSVRPVKVNTPAPALRMLDL